MVVDGELIFDQNWVNVHQAIDSTPLELVHYEVGFRGWEFVTMNVNVEVLQMVINSVAPLLLGDLFIIPEMNEFVVFVDSSPCLVYRFLLVEDASRTALAKAEVSR